MKFIIVLFVCVAAIIADAQLPSEQQANDEYKYSIQENQDKSIDAPAQIKIETTESAAAVAATAAQPSFAPPLVHYTQKPAEDGAEPLKTRQQRNAFLRTTPFVLQPVPNFYFLLDQPQVPIIPFGYFPVLPVKEEAVVAK